MQVPQAANNYQANNIQHLVNSYQKLFDKPLLIVSDQQSLAEQLFTAKFALLSHDTAAEPLFNYANQTALELFESNWQSLIGMASRLSAEPIAQDARERLLLEVSQKGYIDNYVGVRISKTGKRFLIKNAVVWNVYDQNNIYYGQAACFDEWQYV